MQRKYMIASDNELMHHKYIYKKKVNGKWRYYYDVGEASYVDGYTGRKPDRIVGYSKLDDLLGKDERDRANRASAKYERARKNSNNKEYRSNQDMNARFNKVARLGKKAIAANKAYMKTPLGRIEQAKTAFKGAKRAIARIFSRIADKLND